MIRVADLVLDRYKSERDYTSTMDPTTRAVYTSEIVDAGDHPIFKVTPSDDPDNPTTATSASSAWKAILDRIYERRQEGSKKTSISGPGIALLIRSQLSVSHQYLHRVLWIQPPQDC